jgi:hypothetical protein
VAKKPGKRLESTRGMTPSTTPATGTAGRLGAPLLGGGSDAKEAAAAEGDVAFVYGKDAQGTHIVRRRSGEAPLETGLLRPLREGQPIEGEIVTLTPRADVPLLFDVKSELADPRPRPTRDGPAQVASDAYRRGWDAIYSGRRRGDHSVN